MGETSNFSKSSTFINNDFGKTNSYFNKQMTPLKPHGAFLTEAYFEDQLIYDDCKNSDLNEQSFRSHQSKINQKFQSTASSTLNQYNSFNKTQSIFKNNLNQTPLKSLSRPQSNEKSIRTLQKPTFINVPVINNKSNSIKSNIGIVQLKNNYQTEQQKQFSNTINSGFQPSQILKQMQQSHQGVGLKERVHSRKESTEFLIRKSSISNRGSRPSSSQQIQQQITQDFNNDLSEQLLQQQQLQQEKDQILKDQQKHREDRWRQLTDEEQITQLEDVVTTQQQTIRENKREIGLIESDLNRIHRKTLIENQATYSIVLDQIMEFEKSFKRMVNDDKQQKAFIQVQINSMHKEKKMLEYQVNQINSRAQWCQDEIGYDDD